MKIILLRHGTRDYGIGDRPLNGEGLEEAHELSKNPELLQATHLFASPKRRAQMTLEPLSRALGKPITIDENFDQHLSHESEADFSERVKKQLQLVESQIQQGEVYVICSHSDWLALALSHIPTNELHSKDHFFQCAEFASFEIKDGIWTR